MDNSKETWVYDGDAIKHANETDECVCEAGESLVEMCGEWGGWFKWCPACKRTYAMWDEEVVAPDVVLETDEDGLVEYRSEFAYELGLLITMSGYVEDYIELSPTSLGDVVLYARDGVFVGYLIYDRMNPDEPFLRALGIADGYRFEGYGTEFLERWFETIAEDKLEVMAGKDTREFYERLSFPVQ